MKKKLALFGITANPPHRGHSEILKSIVSKFDTVLVHPAARPAWKDNILSYEHRYKMTQLFIEQNQFKNVFVSNIESILAIYKKEEEKIYTFEVARFFIEKYKVRPTLVFGQDNEAQIQKYKNYEYLKENCDFLFLPDNSSWHSSDLRDMFKKEQNTKDIEVYLGKDVFDYVVKNKLYQ